MTVLVVGLAMCFLFVIAYRSKKHTPPKTTERQKQTDELITVVLPTIKK